MSRHNFHSLSYNFIYSSTKFSNLKVGDDFYNDEIIAIDKKLNVIVTKDGGEIFQATIWKTIYLYRIIPLSQFRA